MGWKRESDGAGGDGAENRDLRVAQKKLERAEKDLRDKEQRIKKLANQLVKLGHENAQLAGVREQIQAHLLTIAEL